MLSYSVSQRIPKFGMRIALGASSSDLVRMIVGQGLKISLAGIAIGLVVSLALGRLMASLLYGIGTADPVTFGVVGALGVVTAMLACYVPARRAVNADPMQSLRAD